MATYFAKDNEIARNWFVLDATDLSLGRLASRVASVLRGKHRPEFTAHSDVGDFVVVINAAKIKLTGDKLNGKVYYRHSGVPGGIKAETAGHLLERAPELMIERAVKGMLPKNSLGRRQGKKLKVYAGAVHPHAAQSPQPFTF